MITLTFITRQDCARRATRWSQYAVFSRWEMLKANPSVARDEAKTEQIRQRAEVLVKYFPKKLFWASGLGVPNLRVMAESVGLGWHYSMIYWSGSQATHSSAIAGNEYLEITSDRTPNYRMGLSMRYARHELAAVADSLMQALNSLNQAFHLGIDELLADLVDRYNAIIPAEEGAGTNRE